MAGLEEGGLVAGDLRVGLGAELRDRHDGVEGVAEVAGVAHAGAHHRQPLADQARRALDADLDGVGVLAGPVHGVRRRVGVAGLERHLRRLELGARGVGGTGDLGQRDAQRREPDGGGREHDGLAEGRQRGHRGILSGGR